MSEHGSRERLCGQLMVALYRSDRQAEALEAFQNARRAMREDLGIEPGPALQALQRAILEQDAALAVEPVELRARRHLPAPATSIVGREAELAELAALLRDGSRLVTLTGAGGIGKTRLALQIGRDLAEAFADGVHFVDLAAPDGSGTGSRHDRGRARARHPARRITGRCGARVPRWTTNPAAPRQLRGGRRRGSARERAAACRARAGRDRDEPGAAPALRRAPVSSPAVAAARCCPPVRRAGARGRARLPSGQRGRRRGGTAVRASRLPAASD